MQQFSSDPFGKIIIFAAVGLSAYFTNVEAQSYFASVSVGKKRFAALYGGQNDNKSDR